MKKLNWGLLILVILAAVTRFWNLGSPAEIVFDEVHFGKFISAYFTGEYYFDIHPPLGKLMIAAFGWLFGFKPDFDFEHIGEPFDERMFFILRFLPALFGTLLVLVIYKLILVLGFSRRAAFFGSALVIFDNTLLIESKFVFTDLFFLVFGFSALYFFIRAEKAEIFKNQIIFWILTGIFTGLALSVKWTSLAFLGIIIASLIFGFFRKHHFGDIALKSTVLIGCAALTYTAVFIPHFKLLPKPGGGSAFMSQAFQNELIANQKGIASDERLTFLEKFIELNKVMYSANAGLTAGHPDGSKWYEWPLVRKPVFYWVKAMPPKTASIYLIGNPIIWLLVLLGVVGSIFIMLFPEKTRLKLPPLIYLFLFGYFLNLLPFILVKRVAFLYHYLPALIFGILILALWVEKFLLAAPRKALYLGLLILIVVGFLVMAPLSYGIPLPPSLYAGYQKFINLLH